MKVSAEPSGIKFGNNEVTSSVKTGKWGVMISFIANDTTDFKVILSKNEAELLIKEIKEAFSGIENFKSGLKLLTRESK